MKKSEPGGFTLSMAFMDMLPVLFFSCSAAAVSLHFPSALFRAGAALVILAGALKVSWKFVMCTGRDIPFLSLQMRVLMPAGFLLVLVSLSADRGAWSMEKVWGHICSFPSSICFLAGAAGLVLMSIFAVKLDRKDPKANWIEQVTNSAAQLLIFLGILL